MKKILSSLLLTSASLMMFSQTIFNSDFNSYTTGNLGPDANNTSPGQGGWYSSGGTVVAYQVSSIDAAHGKSISLTSGIGYTTATSNPHNRTANQDFTTIATPGNDYLIGTMDIYTGSGAGLSKAFLSMFGTAAAVGGIGYNSVDQKFFGIGWLSVSGAAPAYYHVGLGAATATAPANTWVSVGFSYNKTTGKYVWITPNGSYTVDANPTVTFVPNLVALDYNLQVQTQTGNAATRTFAFDNLNIFYSNLALGTNEGVKANKVLVEIYPNPTTDVLNVRTDSMVKKVEIFDLAGKKINAELIDGKVDVNNLTAGAYMIKIETNDGLTMKKFIKK